MLRDAGGLPYTLGTCRDVACHAGQSTTSGPVPRPEIDFPFVGYPVVYPPYEVRRRPAYTAPVWGQGPLGCGGCHAYPPRTAFPDTDGGAGESHSYIDAEGAEDLHFFNHGFEPLACATCHHDTVVARGAWERDANDIVRLADVPIARPALHVNGRADVVFDAATPVPYTRPLTLETAGWNAEKRTCTDVSCHMEQREVAFGAPYRYENWVECDACHRY